MKNLNKKQRKAPAERNPVRGGVGGKASDGADRDIDSDAIGGGGEGLGGVGGGGGAGAGSTGGGRISTDRSPTR